MPHSDTIPPLPLVVAVASTLALSAFFMVMAVLSWTAQHGGFSSGVAVALIIWALIVAAGAILLWRGVVCARGAVVAAGLLHVLAFGQFALNDAPWALLGALAGVLAVVGTLMPASRAWLSGDR